LNHNSIAQDSRWSILHSRIGSTMLWQLFNLLFIALYQQFLFICFTLPLNTIVKERVENITPGIIASSILMLASLVLEMLADQQQNVFRQSKYDLLPRQEALQVDYQRGFRTTRLLTCQGIPTILVDLVSGGVHSSLESSVWIGCCTGE